MLSFALALLLLAFLISCGAAFNLAMEWANGKDKARAVLRDRTRQVLRSRNMHKAC